MAMYVQLLSAVLMADRADSSAPGELLLRARTSRRQLLASPDHSRCSAERDLAYEVHYDCALIRLCAAEGIETTPTAFGQPRVERTRLERALATTGMDLTYDSVPRSAPLRILRLFLHDGPRRPRPRCGWSS
jgi:hypothetical protein